VRPYHPRRYGGGGLLAHVNVDCVSRGARQIRLRIDATWRWATAISEDWQQLERPSPEHPDHRPPRPERPHGPGKPAHPSDTGRPVLPARHNQRQQAGQNRRDTTRQRRWKTRGSHHNFAEAMCRNQAVKKGLNFNRRYFIPGIASATWIPEDC
jgi:hypothetical protein